MWVWSTKEEVSCYIYMSPINNRELIFNQYIISLKFFKEVFQEDQ